MLILMRILDVTITMLKDYYGSY